MQSVEAEAQVPTRTSRTRRISVLRLVFGRTEVGSIIGLTAIWITLAITAGRYGFLTVDGTVSYLQVGAGVGLIGSAVTLLMIGGEFDLSVGSMVGFSGMVLALCLVSFGLPLWLSLLISLSIAVLYGFMQGWIVVRTGLPSFIVTLAGFFTLRGLSIGLAITLQKTPVVPVVFANVPPDPTRDPILSLFKPNLVGPLDILIFLFVGLALGATWILNHTTFGNWIYATGGSASVARGLGVPVRRVKITLFMFTAFSAWLLATYYVLSYGSADALRGQGKEFEGVLTAVIGGSLLFGGHGSPIGTVFGAITLGMLYQGLFFAGVDADWYLAILGLVLLVAVLINEAVRRTASETHR